MSPRHLKRYLHHPYNALLYYQAQDLDRIDVPEPLLTQFQEFGSVYLNPYEKKSNAPTEKLFRSVETNIQLLMMARYCVYKWISPFNDMVAKLQERSDKIMMDIHEDLSTQAYRLDGQSNDMHLKFVGFEVPPELKAQAKSNLTLRSMDGPNPYNAVQSACAVLPNEFNLILVAKDSGKITLNLPLKHIIVMK